MNDNMLTNIIDLPLGTWMILVWVIVALLGIVAFFRRMLKDANNDFQDRWHHSWLFGATAWIIWIVVGIAGLDA